MKQLYLILIFFWWGCRSQSPVLPLPGSGARSQQGAYYKDIDNIFNKFSGTWKFQNGQEIFTITLQKKVMKYDADDNIYLDILIGEYAYTNSNGLTIVNTLNNLNQDMAPFKNNIGGAVITNREELINLRGVEMYFRDPERLYLNQYILLKFIEGSNGIANRIEVKFRGDTSLLPNENSPKSTRVPVHDYILTKVN